MRHRHFLFTLTLMIAFVLFLNSLNVSQRNVKRHKQLYDAQNYYTQEIGDPGGWNLLKRSGTALDSGLRVIYNRVPKCGSRSALSLFKTLSLKNGFKVVNPAKNYPYALEEQGQKKINDFISSLRPPFLFHRHMYYVDFTRHGGPPVVYINLIRDPLSRAVSHFYFRRHGDGILGKSRLGKPIDNEKNNGTTYDECVLLGHPECVGNWGRFFTVPFFCGHTAECRSPSRWALEQAKLCVVKKYLVVGLVEEFEDFVKVLENLLPSFFKGAYKTWKVPDVDIHQKAVSSQTRHKKKPSEKVIAMAKKLMHLEYEFYDFVKERFHALKKELGI